MSTIDELIQRKSMRKFEDRLVPEDLKATIIECAINAPTAGNQMLYAIVDITDPTIKQALALSCDNQGFIAEAPLVLVFLADCRRWQDAYELAGCQPCLPQMGDLILACEDTMIAAHNAVVAAESLGLGSCYIGDIVENREQVVELLNLDPLVFPITMVVFGYPTAQQIRRTKPKRFDPKYIVHTNQYRRLTDEEIRQMFTDRGEDFDTFIPAFCKRKYMSDFAAEMNRSVAGYCEAFQG